MTSGCKIDSSRSFVENVCHKLLGKCGIVAYLTIYVVTGLYLSISERYFDGDTLRVLLRIKNDPSLGAFQPFSFLQGMISYFLSKIINVDIVSAAIITSFLFFVLASVILYSVVWNLSKSYKMSLLTVIFFTQFRSVFVLLLTIDDNIVPLPFVIMMAYFMYRLFDISRMFDVQNIYNRRKFFFNYLLLCILLALSMLAHLQSVVFLPIIFIGLYISKIPRRDKLIAAISGLTSVIFVWLPFIILNFIQRGLLIPNSLFNIKYYLTDRYTSTFYLTQSYSLFGRNISTIGDVIVWIIGYAQGPGLSLFFGMHQSFYQDFSIVRMIFHFYAWLLVIISILPIRNIRKIKNDTLENIETFQLISASFILMGMIFTFLYEPNHQERWIHIMPFIAFNLSVVVLKWINNSDQIEVVYRLKQLVALLILISLLFMLLFHLFQPWHL